MRTSTPAVILRIPSVVVVVTIVVTIATSHLVVVSTVAFGWGWGLSNGGRATIRLFVTIPGVPVAFWRAKGGKDIQHAAYEGYKLNELNFFFEVPIFASLISYFYFLASKIRHACEYARLMAINKRAPKIEN